MRSLNSLHRYRQVPDISPENSTQAWALKSKQAEILGCPILGWTQGLSDGSVHGPEVGEVAANRDEGKLAFAELLVAGDVRSLKIVKHTIKIAIVHKGDSAAVLALQAHTVVGLVGGSVHLDLIQVTLHA